MNTYSYWQQLNVAKYLVKCLVQFGIFSLLKSEARQYYPYQPEIV